MGISSTKTRRHRGDIMSPEKRSAVMARIRGKDTGPELLLAREFDRLGLQFESHARDLPGRPDFAFRQARVAVFVDGDFWHGWNFSEWRDKLTEKWETKIAANRTRDARASRLLRAADWKVVRIWEHQIDSSLPRCVARVVRAIRGPSVRGSGSHTKPGEKEVPGQRTSNLVHAGS